MSSISDVIEQFILEAMGVSSSLSFSRNDLANHFSCVPSQINYVLSTRFSASRGYLIESQRGGGGFVKIIKLDFSKTNNQLNDILTIIGDEVSYREAMQILNLLAEANLLKPNQIQDVSVLFTDKSLANPFKLQSRIRANMLKELIYNQIKEK